MSLDGSYADRATGIIARPSTMRGAKRHKASVSLTGNLDERVLDERTASRKGEALAADGNEARQQADASEQQIAEHQFGDMRQALGFGLGLAQVTTENRRQRVLIRQIEIGQRSDRDIELNGIDA